MNNLTRDEFYSYINEIISSSSFNGPYSKSDYAARLWEIILKDRRKRANAFKKQIKELKQTIIDLGSQL